MPNYPCPPVGFQFTEENYEQATKFYWEWLDKAGLYDASVMQDCNKLLVSSLDFSEKTKMPWTVINTVTFTETPLAEGENHA